MQLETEFKKFVKDYANKIEYDISSEELDYLYKGFFGENIGIMNLLISSRIQDLIYEKQHSLDKTNEMDNQNEQVCEK